MFRKTQAGTFHWFAPEIVEGSYYSKSVDIWAYGCFAYELATGNPPFHDLKDDSLFFAITQRDFDPVPESLPELFVDLISGCLKKDTQHRLTVDQILDHEFLQGAEGLKE